MPRRDSTIQRVETHIDELCDSFEDYLNVFYKEPPFKFDAYRKAIDSIELQGSTKSAISNNECLVSVWESLDAWGMNSGRAKLVDETTFINQFHRHQDLIASFENTVIENINSGTIDRLWETIEELSLADNRSQIVAGSKALHHLLPHLVPLIDREYTRPFCSYQHQEFQDNEPVFKFMMSYFREIAQRIDLVTYVGRTGWATSPTKVIDNAIVGYGIEHRRHSPRSVPKCCAEAPSLWRRYG